MVARHHALKRLWSAVLFLGLAACSGSTRFHPSQTYLNSADNELVFNEFASDPAWQELPGDFTPRAGIVSHHLLAHKEINAFFKALSERVRPSVFIVVTPNHFLQGKARISLSPFPWRTYSGSVESDKAIYQRLLAAGGEEDPHAFDGEHGIGALVPYIEKFFPGARMVAVSLRQSHWDRARVLSVGREVGNILKQRQNVFLLLSADFSHYADPETTRERDRLSRHALETYQFELFRANYIDNKVGLLLLEKAAMENGTLQAHIAFNTDGYRIAGATVDVTSYFFVYFQLSS